MIDAPKSSKDLERISMVEFQQPIRCCNVTALAYGLTLLADYDTETGELTVGDVNPRKYTRFWKCPVERMYKACVDKDSASDRSRGLLVLRKEQA